MQITGMLWGGKLLDIVEFPRAKTLGPDATDEQVKALIAEAGEVFVKPVFRGGVGKKGKAGLLGRAKNIHAAIKEKERLYFVEHTSNGQRVKSEGVTTSFGTCDTRDRPTFSTSFDASFTLTYSVTDSSRPGSFNASAFSSFTSSTL